MMNECYTSFIVAPPWSTPDAILSQPRIAEDMLNRVPWDLIYQEWWGEYPPQDSWCQRTGFLNPVYGVRVCSFILGCLKLQQDDKDFEALQQINMLKQFTTKTSRQPPPWLAAFPWDLKVEKLHDLASYPVPCPISQSSKVCRAFRIEPTMWVYIVTWLSDTVVDGSGKSTKQ